MKNNFLIYLGCIFCISTCRMPSDPLGEISIIKHLPTINTGGNCLDIDVDISDSVLVVASNYNGYFIYDINYNGEIISGITEHAHISSDKMDNNLGDNRAQTVVLSKNYNIAFVMDQYDHIWLYKYGDGATQYSPPNYLEEDCYGGTWLSVSIDEQSDRIGVFTLLKHNAAEDSVGYFLEYSTSLVWTNLKGVNLPSTSPDQFEPNCEYIINQGSIAEQIYFSDGLLSMAYGELGVRVFQQTEVEVCLTDTGFVDLNGIELCVDHIDYNSCCNNDTCPLSKPNCNNDDEYISTNGMPGLGGIFASSGGIIPIIFAEFDTPGEVETLYATGKTIFAGLSNSNGGMFAILNNDGLITGPQQFANGYTIKGIHSENGLLALAAGHDGILLYNWNGHDVSFMGKIETAYANNVKVAGNIIFAATEDGIEIIQINYTP